MAQTVVLRWESFFEELQSFIRTSNRHLRNAASEFYAHSAIERFQLAIASIANIIRVFQDNPPPATDQELLSVWREHLSTLQQLLQCCRSLASQWEAYVDSINKCIESMPMK